MSRISANLQFYSALYVQNDPYESTDAVFGVKNSLIVPIQRIADDVLAKRYGVEIGSAFLTYDFVLVTESAAAALRRQKAEESFAQLGRKFKFINDLPVPDLD
jgi:hypothetical protein